MSLNQPQFFQNPETALNNLHNHAFFPPYSLTELILYDFVHHQRSLCETQRPLETLQIQITKLLNHQNPVFISSVHVSKSLQSSS